MRSLHSPRWWLHALAMSVFSLMLTSPLVQAADPATVCETAKLKTAGKMADCLAKEEAKALLGKPSNPLMCVTAFSKAFTRAEANAALAGGSCPVTGDVTAVEALVDTCVDDFWTRPLTLPTCTMRTTLTDGRGMARKRRYGTGLKM